MEDAQSGDVRAGLDEAIKRDILDKLFYIQGKFSEVATISHLDSEHWTRMSILNGARMGKFSSDRAIGKYCRDIWEIQVPKMRAEH
jgi:glucan phosphorylase